jgi:hypothetical protein
MRDNRNPRFADYEELLPEPAACCCVDFMETSKCPKHGRPAPYAPSTRVVDQFTGRVTDPVQSEQQVDYLLEQNAELKCRNQELEAENEELKATARLVIETIERLLAD